MPGGLFKTGADNLERSANLANDVWLTLQTAGELEGDIRGADAKHLCRALFRYCLAIVHAPQYESDHNGVLAQDWPHIPIVKEKAQFKETVNLGGYVAQLLDPLADPSALLKKLLGTDGKTLAVVERTNGDNISEAELVVEYSYYGAAVGRWDERPAKASESLHREWGDVTGDLYLNDTIVLKHVPKEVWQYELGGYPVLKKWLGYRQANRRGNAPLSMRELDYFRGMVHRIAGVLLLRTKLGDAYKKASANPWLVDELLHGSREITHQSNRMG